MDLCGLERHDKFGHSCYNIASMDSILVFIVQIGTELWLDHHMGCCLCRINNCHINHVSFTSLPDGS